MRIKYIYLTLIVFCITGNMAKASQPNSAEETDSLPTLIFAVQPMYTAISGMRLDVDITLHKNHSLQLSPILFYSNNFSGSDISGVYFDRKRGAGFHLYHRFYPGEGLGKSKFYISHGPVWHYNYINWEETIPGTKAERHNSIHKLGWDVMIGRYLISTDRLVLDIYTGMGLRHSILTTDADNKNEMNYNYWSPGYSGAILLVGFRLGVATGMKSF
jgi:hypothetical protein